MWKGRLLSFKYAFQGLWDLLRSQPNARIHLLATLLAIALGIGLGIDLTEWALVIVAIAAVWSAEAFNTALEYLTDLVQPDFHPLAGRAKDAAAAGVLVSALGAAAIGFLVFLPKLWAILMGG